MPTYEFTCPQGHDFDKFFRSMASAPTVVPCPVCNQPAERQMSAGAGLVFHGSGFYITDYGKDGKKDQKPAVSRNGDSSKSESAGDAKPGDAKSSDSKPAEPKTDSGSGSSSGGEAKSGGESAPKAPEAPAKPAAPAKASE